MIATPCMVDGAGRQVATWQPHMQSTEFLRASIAKGERTAECWGEIQRRTARTRRGAEIIAKLQAHQ